MIFLFVLALAAGRHRIQIHAFCVLSNHVHLVVTDVRGELPAFMRYLDSLVARAVNATLGRFEGFWARNGSYTAVEPLDRGDVVAKVAYALANPVAAGLVRTGAEWPGLRSAPAQEGRTRFTASRPNVFFRQKGYLPAQVELELTPPPGFRSAEEFGAEVAAAVEALEEGHRRARAAKGQRFLGAARVLLQDPLAAPLSPAPRFTLKPRVAARDSWRRIQGLLRLKEFEDDYREAFRAWCAGARSVVFPAGTYLMRVLHGVQCAQAT